MRKPFYLLAALALLGAAACSGASGITGTAGRTTSAPTHNETGTSGPPPTCLRIRRGAAAARWLGGIGPAADRSIHQVGDHLAVEGVHQVRNEVGRPRRRPERARRRGARGW